ncbi:MAG: YcxB family protein, partial [Shewanella sp.]
IHTQSMSVTSQILWHNIYRIKETQQGFLITHKAGTSYVSFRSLDDMAVAYINTKI